MIQSHPEPAGWTEHEHSPIERWVAIYTFREHVAACVATGVWRDP
jgi:hypothetical protein